MTLSPLLGAYWAVLPSQKVAWEALQGQVILRCVIPWEASHSSVKLMLTLSSCLLCGISSLLCVALSHLCLPVTKSESALERGTPEPETVFLMVQHCHMTNSNPKSVQNVVVFCFYLKSTVAFFEKPAMSFSEHTFCRPGIVLGWTAICLLESSEIGFESKRFAPAGPQFVFHLEQSFMQPLLNSPPDLPL